MYSLLLYVSPDFRGMDRSCGERQGALREKLQGIDMSGPNDAEVPAVQRRNLTNTESLRGGNDRGVGRSDGQIAVGDHQLRDPQPVGGRDRLSDKVPGSQVAQKPSLGFDAESRGDQVVSLGHNENGDDQRPWMCLQQLEARFVVAIIRIDVCVQRSSVHQNRYRDTSALRISSMCSEMSVCPLWPALPAISRRPLPGL